MQGVVRAFMEFTEEKVCASPNHPEHGAEYFKPHGLALNENLVRQFLLWYADTALGKISSMSWRPSATISSARTTVKSVEITAYALFCAAAYYNTSVPRGLRQDTKIWINGPLCADMDLVRHKIPKPIASHTDVEIAIRAMWDVRSLASIRTFRIRFIATLI